MKRVIAFDFLRGIAIIGVLLFHVMNIAYKDVVDAVKAGTAPIQYMILGVPLVFFGSFNGLFIMISAGSNIISVQKQWEKLVSASVPTEKAFYKVLSTQLIRGAFIWIFGWVSEGLFSGLLGLLTGDSPEQFLYGLVKTFYFSNILQAIGIALIISSVIYLFFLRFKTSRKKASIILIVIAVVVLAIQPVVRAVLPEELRGNFGASDFTAFINRGFGMNLLLFIGAPFLGRLAPQVPFFACAAIGTLIAMFINQKAVTPEFLQKLFIWGFIVMGIAIPVGLVLEALDIQALDISRETSLFWFLFVFGGEIFSTAWLLYMIDFRRKTNLEVFLKHTVTLRRFGLVTLTLWCLQYVMVFPIILIEGITGWPIIEGGLNDWQILIVLGLLWLMWHLILWLWEKVNFKGSFEWMTTLVIAKRSTTTGDRLKVAETLYHPERLLEWVPGSKRKAKESQGK